MKYHPLVESTRKELLRLDKHSRLTWEERKEYNS